MVNRLVPLQFYPEPGAHRALGAVGADQGCRGETVAATRCSLGDVKDRFGSVAVPSGEQLRHLMAEPQVYQPGSGRGVEEDLFDEILGRHDRLGGTDLRPGAFEPGGFDGAELVSGDRIEESQRTFPARRGVDVPQPPVDLAPPSSGDLHRAGVEVTGLRVKCDGLVLFEHMARHTEPGEFEAGGQSHGSAADDHHPRRLTHLTEFSTA